MLGTVINSQPVSTRQLAQSAQSMQSPPLEVVLAESILDLRASQRLRYRVFVEEMGADISCAEPGLDSDALDAFCQHILVRERTSGEVVASTRVLSDGDARLAGGFYSQSEFDLSRWLPSAGRVLEVGRTCVHPAYRNGAAISLLLSGLACLVELRKFDYLIGCASVSMADGGVNARAVFDLLKEKYLLPPEKCATPRHAVPIAGVAGNVAAVMPPLLKAYIRLGARIGGEPCWDVDFGCADFLVVLSPALIERKYARHFMDRCA